MSTKTKDESQYDKETEQPKTNRMTLLTTLMTRKRLYLPSNPQTDTNRLWRRKKREGYVLESMNCLCIVFVS